MLDFLKYRCKDLISDTVTTLGDKNVLFVTISRVFNKWGASGGSLTYCQNPSSASTSRPNKLLRPTSFFEGSNFEFE